MTTDASDTSTSNVTRKQIMDLADRRMLNHRCGRCMADVGAWCKTARGSRASMLHSARFYAAQAAGHLPLTVRVMRDGSHMYWFTRWDVFADAVDSLTPFLPVANMLVWDKGHPGMGDLTLYGYSHELVLFAVKGKRPLVGGRPGNIFRHNPVPPVHRTHVTEKPVGLLRPWIEASAPDCLLDPFAGSGSALLAAQQLGRRAVGVEIEERYCEAAATRLSAARDDLFGGAA